MFNRPKFSTSGARKAIATVLAGALLSTTMLTGAVAQTAEPSPNSPAAAETENSSSANGEDSNRAGERMERRGESREGRAERHGKPHHGRYSAHHRGGGMMAMMTPARVATALAALETGIGITQEQIDVWREFSSAATAFAIAAQPGFGPRGGGDGGPSEDAAENDSTAQPDEAVEPGEQDTAVNSDAEQPDASSAERRGPSPFDFIDRITERAIASGDAATRLQTASADLQDALTPEQVETATALVRSMMREVHSQHGNREGMKGHHGRHGAHHGTDRGHRGHHDRHHGGRD